MAAAAATATATATASVAALQEKQSQELSQYGAVRPRSSSCVAHVERQMLYGITYMWNLKDKLVNVT